MTFKDGPSLERGRGSGMLAVGGLLGALAASACCILPLVLFSLGVSGAWIANLTQLAPYQPYVIVATLACLSGGYWLVYRASRACGEGAACARPLPNRLVKTGRSGACWSSPRSLSMHSPPSFSHHERRTS